MATQEPNSATSPAPPRASVRPTVPVVTVAGLTKTYPGSKDEAVDDLSFAVNEGETLALLGPSGCGKTTTLRLIAGFEEPDAGDVRVRERVVASPSEWVPPEKRGLAMMFQQFALFPHLRVIENVAYGLKGMGRARREERALLELERVGMAEYAGRYPHQLSGGQQQRVALARALAPEPLVLLMDEPFGSLDAGLRAEMRREVKSILTQRRATTILVTHDQDEAFTLADRILILNQGRLEQLNTPDNIYHRPATRVVASFVGTADFLPVRFGGHHVVSELGTFAYEGAAPDGEVDLLVRPDDINIESDVAGQGLVVDREFKGASNLYAVRLPSGRTVRSVQPSDTLYEVGERVRVSGLPSHIVLFPRAYDSDAEEAEASS